MRQVGFSLLVNRLFSFCLHTYNPNLNFIAPFLACAVRNTKQNNCFSLIALVWKVSQHRKDLPQKKNSNVKPNRRIRVLYTAQKFHGNRYNWNDICVMNMHGMPTYSSPILTEILNRYSKWLLNLKFPLRYLLHFQSYRNERQNKGLHTTLENVETLIFCI